MCMFLPSPTFPYDSPSGLSCNPSLYVRCLRHLSLLRHSPLSDIPRVYISSFVPFHFSSTHFRIVSSPNFLLTSCREMIYRLWCLVWMYSYTVYFVRHFGGLPSHQQYAPLVSQDLCMGTL